MVPVCSGRSVRVLCTTVTGGVDVNLQYPFQSVYHCSERNDYKYPSLYALLFFLYSFISFIIQDYYYFYILKDFTHACYFRIPRSHSVVSHTRVNKVMIMLNE